MIEKLKVLGFDDDEANVYISVLKLDNKGATAIAKETGINRVNCYYILDKLFKKGAVTQKEINGVKSYSAVNIDILFAKLERDFYDLKQNIPQIQSIAGIIRRQPNIQFFKGMEGIKSLLEDTLKAEKEIVGFVNLEYQLTNSLRFLKYELSEYASKRIQNNIRFRGLYVKNEGSFYMKAKKEGKEAVRDIRFLPAEKFAINHEINIYNDKVAYFFVKDNDIYGILIQDEDITMTQRSFFEFLWNISLNFDQSIPKSFNVDTYEAKILKSLDAIY